MEAWQKRVAEWAQHPRQFVREALNATPEPGQDEALVALADGHRRIAIRAGHGVGKSAFEAWVIIWFLLFRRPCKIPVTANSQDQLRDVVWAEVGRWLREMPPFLRDLIEINSERIYVRSDPEGAFAVARTARPEKPEALQGFHSPNLLFVLEEASGIEDIIFETAGGALTGSNSLVIMCGNPTRTQGYFYRAFHQNRESWTTFHVPCSASSRVSPSYATDIAKEYGEQSNVYRVRVLGEFPLSEDDAVIPLGLIEAAVNRDVVPTEHVGIVWGLDVARFGDDTTALAKRRGNALREPVKEWRKLDLMQTVGIVAKEYNETPIDERPAAINVDVIGLGGGVVDRGREIGLPMRGINVGESPASDGIYMRLRDELWFKGRQWFVDLACRIPKDDGLIAELVSPKYKYESSGKIKVESKDDMKKRGVKSPNKADAFLLTFAGGEIMLSRRLPVAVDYNPFQVGTEHFARDVVRQEFAGLDWDPLQ
jgi:phage terminase large subunit